MKKKLTVFCLASVCALALAAEALAEIRIAPPSPQFLKWREEIKKPANVSSLSSLSVRNNPVFRTGYVPSPVDLSHLVKNPPKVARTAEALAPGAYRPASWGSCRCAG